MSSESPSLETLRTAFRDALNTSALHDAHQIAQAMLERSGDATDAHMDMTDVLLAMGEARRAKRHITISLKQGGTNPRVMTQLGAARGALWDTKGACEAFRQVVDMTPHDAEVWANLANALLRNGDVCLAEQAITTALSLDDEHADIQAIAGSIAMAQGALAKAGNHLSEAVRLAPDDPETRYRLGLQRLACGDFETGWSLHEFGLKAPQRRLERSIEVWSGESLTNKTLYIAAEQGVGDEVMFASCLPELITSHPSTRILLDCDPRLQDTFQRSFPSIQVLGLRGSKLDEDGLSSDDIDYQISIGSLPKLYRRTLDAFPSRTKYLYADKSKAMYLGAKLPTDKSTLTVGVAWRGGGLPHTLKARTVPLPYWPPVLETSSVRFVNLQFGNTKKDITKLSQVSHVTLADLELDGYEDLDGVMAALTNLDLLISVDNSLVHFAGALGVKTWALVPFAADWRWMRDRIDTPWYPSVELIRRAQNESLPALMERVTQKLNALVSVRQK